MRFKVTTIAVLATVIIGLSSTANAAKVTLKLGNNAAPNHVYNVISNMYAKAVAEASKNEIEIKVFPADQLGNQRQLVEGAQLGTTDMVLTSDSMLSNFIPEFSVLNLPFIFRDIDHVGKVMDGPVGDHFKEVANKKGLVVLGWWENGFRSITNSKHPINTVSDLKGLKLRVSPGKLAVTTFKTFGALATPMATGEVYSALQLGTIDGQENSASFVLGQKYYEVQKYLSITRHQHNVEPLVISKHVYKKLTPEQQKVLQDEAKKLTPKARELVIESDDKIIAELKKHMEVNEVKDTSTFFNASKPIYEKYESQYGEIIKRIVETK